MNIIDFKIDSKRQWIKSQRKNIRMWLTIGLIYPALIAWGIGDTYYHPLNWVKSFALGVNVTSYFWYLIVMLEAIGDYRCDKRILEFYEKNYAEN